MSLRTKLLLAAGVGIGGAVEIWLLFFDRDMKTIRDEINAERARRVHAAKPYRLPYLEH